jgi:hypothetical protein
MSNKSAFAPLAAAPADQITRNIGKWQIVGGRLRTVEGPLETVVCRLGTVVVPLGMVVDGIELVWVEMSVVGESKPAL